MTFHNEKRIRILKVMDVIGCIVLLLLIGVFQYLLALFSFSSVLNNNELSFYVSLLFFFALAPVEYVIVKRSLKKEGEV